jgi:3-oxoacyl-[acyl-carrier protein] reductase
MDLGINGRVAIVCAASRGLGKAAALAFAREGVHVVICARDASSLESAAREIRAAATPGVRVIPVTADLTDPAASRSLAATAVRELGRIDILITNAGGPPVAEFPDLDDATWEKGVQLTLMSTIRCIREVLPYMKKQRWGRILNITSITARQPISDLVISSTLRPGILGLSKVLANRYAKEGILVNTVTPGYFLTERQEEIGTTRAAKGGQSLVDYLSQTARDIPVGRLGEPSELADVIVFLCSERSSYVTGVTLGVDGGMARGLL